MLACSLIQFIMNWSQNFIKNIFYINFKIY